MNKEGKSKNKYESIDVVVLMVDTGRSYFKSLTCTVC